MSKGDNFGKDYETCISLQGLMQRNNQFLVLKPIDDISLVKGIIGAAAYSIGLSYHLNVFSLSQGHPTLILYTGDYYKIKSEGLISYYAPPNRSVNFAEVSIGQAVDYVHEIEENYHEVCIGIKQVNKKIFENDDWTIKELRKKLIENNLIDESKVA